MEFNQQNDRNRESIILKNKWENKKKIKKNHKRRKSIRGATGGGPHKNFKVTDIDLEIKEMLGKQVTGRTSYFDSEGQNSVCSDEDAENEIIVLEMENGVEENYELLPFDDTQYEHHENVNLKEFCNNNFEEETAPTQSNVYLQKNKDIPEHPEPGSSFAAAALRKPKSAPLKVNNSLMENHVKKHDVLKTNLGKWALSKTTLVETQKQHLEEEHKKKMENLDKRQKLELTYMKEEHEARMAKILKS